MRYAGIVCLLTFTTLTAAPAAARQVPSPTREWPRSEASGQGLREEPLAQLAERLRSGAHGYIDRMVVVRNGYVVVDERFANDYHEISRGKSTSIGCGIDACPDPAELNQYNYLHPDWHPWWQGGDLHTLQSITKTVTATVIGAALERGEIASVGAHLLSFFGEYDLDSVDARLHEATLADLLTMRSGIEWHETDRPVDETNTTFQLERSTDWIRFTLMQPTDAAPGEKWVYNSGGSQLMSEVIRSATGQHVDRYAEQHLFGPLGIRDYHWKTTPTGHPDTEGGLYLEALDLAKIGQLYLNDGVWDGRRILPAGWAREATARHVDRTSDNPNAPGYGYQWFRYDRRDTEVWAGSGFGGQGLLILPRHGMVVVINGWNVFGDQVPSVLGPLIDALLESAGVTGEQ